MIGALISIRPVSFSASAPDSSDGGDRLVSAVTLPAAAVSVPVPPALPTPMTASPTLTSAALAASFAVCRPEAFCSLSTATSSVGAVPTTSAL